MHDLSQINVDHNESLKKKELPKKKKVRAEIKYSSAVERFLGEKFAPELLTNQGRASIIVIWLVMSIVAVIGCMNLTIAFSINDFIPPDSPFREYFDLDQQYLNSGFTPTIYVENDTLDYSSPEV